VAAVVDKAGAPQPVAQQVLLPVSPSLKLAAMAVSLDPAHPAKVVLSAPMTVVSVAHGAKRVAMVAGQTPA
jgi:hypothetical protein